MPRKTKKRSHKRRHHKRRSMKGGFYGFSGSLDGQPGVPNLTGVRNTEMGGVVGNRGGNSLLSTKPYPMKGGKRRRRKTMRGGGSFGATSAAFNGTGYRGMANYSQTNTKGPPIQGPAKHGAFNDGGAHPGNFKSFGGLLPK